MIFNKYSNLPTIAVAIFFSVSILFIRTVYGHIIIGAAISLCAIVLPELYVLLFLLMRSMLDIASEYKIGGYLNMSSVLTLLLIYSVVIILLKKENVFMIKNDNFLSNFNKLMCVFLISCLPSFINTQNFVISLSDWLRLVSVGAVLNFAYIYCYDNRKRLSMLVSIFILSSIVPICLGIYQIVANAGNFDTPGFNRIYGTFLHPNVLAEYLMIILFCVLYLLLSNSSKFLRKGAFVCFSIIIIFEIINTYARTIWIALAAALIVFGSSFQTIVKKTKYFLIIFFIAILIMPVVVSRFAELSESQIYGMNSWEWRLMTWKGIINAIAFHPIIGQGLGMYEATHILMAHNDYLRLLYEMGIIGLAAYLIVIFYILFFSLKGYIKENDRRGKLSYAVVICLVGSLLIISMADNMARSTVALIYIFSFIGALLSQRGESLRILK